jgi:hypothetical protein
LRRVKDVVHFYICSWEPLHKIGNLIIMTAVDHIAKRADFWRLS